MIAMQNALRNIGVLQGVRGKCVYLDVAYVSHICCKYFI
jgi:hypothetical protein